VLPIVSAEGILPIFTSAQLGKFTPALTTIIFGRGKKTADATRHFALHRQDALDAVLSPA